MIRRLVVFFLLCFYVVFLVTPVLAQDPPEEDQDSSNTPATTRASEIVGPIDTGKAGKACRTDITISKSNIVDNFDFNIPLVPGWAEDLIFGAMINALGGSDDLFGETADNLNALSEGKLCVDGSTPSTEDPNEVAKGNCMCIGKTSFTAEEDFCGKLSQAQGGGEKAECQDCVKKGMWTAIGCIEYDFKNFIVKTVFKFGVGLGGLIALACIVYASIILQMSQGDPEKIQHSRELITSCIIGLLLIIFSIFILQFIGVQLLNLDQFGAPLEIGS